LSDTLFTMTNADFYTKFLVDVFSNMLGTIDRAMLSAGASEGNLQVGETTLLESGDMKIDELIDTLKKGEDFAVLLEKVDDGLVKSGKGLVLSIATRIVGASAVEHIATTIARLVLGDTLLKGEREDINHKMVFPCPALLFFGIEVDERLSHLF